MSRKPKLNTVAVVRPGEVLSTFLSKEHAKYWLATNDINDAVIVPTWRSKFR